MRIKVRKYGDTIFKVLAFDPTHLKLAHDSALDRLVHKICCKLGVTFGAGYSLHLHDGG